VATLIVIPTYEEAANVAPMIEALGALGPGISVLIVDDSSPDGTGGQVARLAAAGAGRVSLMTRPRKAGHGSAYREGLIRSLAAGRHDSFVVMDCDFSHDPAAVPVLLAALRAADVAVGSRYVRGGRVSGWGPHRHLLSRAANGVARRLLGLPVRDCTSGFMAFRRTALEAMALLEASAEAYAAPVEMKWLAWRAGLRIAEVPITFRDRERGSSKLDATLILEAARGLWRLNAGRSTPPGARRAPRSPGGPPPAP
jgi:dolichol-phosphate mannosyltransferase